MLVMPFQEHLKSVDVEDEDQDQNQDQENDITKLQGLMIAHTYERS